MAKKKIHGYVRDQNSGGPAVGISVTLYHDNYPSANTAVATGNQWGLATNPVVTDSKGQFDFDIELSPGPIVLIADLDGVGTELRYRFGDETNQTGTWFLSDLDDNFGDLYSNGLMGTEIPANYKITMSGVARQGTLDPGKALVEGHRFETVTAKNIVFSANPSLAIRRDFVCLRQWVAQYPGRQEIVVLEGTVSDTDPVSPGVNYVDYPLYRVVTNQNAGVSTVSTDLRSYVKIKRIGTASIPWDAIDPATVPPATIPPGSVTTTQIADGTIQAVDIADGTITGAKLAASAKIFGFVRTIPGYSQVVSDVSALNFGPGFSVVKRSGVNEADINLSGSGSNITKWKDTNFNSWGTIFSGNINPLATATLSLDPGDWFIECDLNMTISSQPNNCTIIGEFTGNLAPIPPDNSSRIFRGVGGVPRTIRLTGRKRITVATTGNYTVNFKVTFNNGDGMTLEDGCLYVIARPD